MEGGKGAVEVDGDRVEDGEGRMEDDGGGETADFKMPILPKHTPIWSLPSSPAGQYSNMFP